MKYSKSIFTMLLIVGCSAQLYSQGYYLERGQNGFGISAGFASNKNASSIGGSAGYSASGIFDFGLSISQISFEEKLIGEDVSATALSPFITLHVVKQNETTPVSVALSASYENDSYSSNALDQYNLELSASGITIGALIYGDINTSPTMKVQPSIGLRYFSSESEIKDNSGNSITSKDDGTIVGIGVGLLFQTAPNTIFGISPSIGIHKSNTSFSLSAGLIFIL